MFNLSANQLPSATPFGLPNGAAHFPLQQQIQQAQQHLQQLQQLQHLLQQQQFAPQFQQPYGQQPFGQQNFQPQGFFGDLLKQYGGAAGGAIGGLFGQPGLGQSIGNVAGQIGGFLPFQAMPQFQQHLQPQGFFGDLLKQYGGAAGGAIGGLFGQPEIGQIIGNAAGRLGNFLPFQLQPGQQSMSQFPIPQFPMSQFGGLSPANLPIQFSQQPGLC